MQQPQSNPLFRPHPTQLSKTDRANHVLRAILNYNQGIIKNNPSGAKAKFERLKLSPFIFMRGTADLMYQDLAGTDGDKALILCVGDVHLENFGVMETEDKYLTWGVNDFDEATFAPFVWDVKRGAVSVFLAAREQDFSKKEIKKLTQAFSKNYLKQLKQGFSDKEDNYLKIGLIKQLLQSTQKVNSEDWLRENYLNPESSLPVFRTTDELKPLQQSLLKKRLPVIQKAINQYLKRLQKQTIKAPKRIKVLDLATKTGSGTASIGLWRYYILAEAKYGKRSELMILEMKQMRPSVLSPYTHRQPLMFEVEGERVNYAEHIQLDDANPYYGYTELDGINYLIRKRSPYKNRIKLKKLKKYKDFKTYVKACGMALAHAHLLASAAMYNKKKASKAILSTIETDVFIKKITFDAIKMAKQVVVDWKSFCSRKIPY